MCKRLVVVFCIVSALALAACSAAPTKEQVSASLKSIIPIPFEVLGISGLKEIPGLYEVVLRANKQTLVLYTDEKAKYVLSGSLMALDNKRNLTQETQNKYLQK